MLNDGASPVSNRSFIKKIVIIKGHKWVSNIYVITEITSYSISAMTCCLMNGHNYNARLLFCFRVDSFPHIYFAKPVQYIKVPTLNLRDKTNLVLKRGGAQFYPQPVCHYTTYG